ncbi:MAG: beta-galactosidase [Patescibacteria group bacterium]
MIYGASFSSEHARYLGLEPKEVFKTILDEWNFKYIRLSAQWDLIEKEKGKYDFSELDYFMDETAKREGKVLLAVGQKIPRWPECHLPKWSVGLPEGEYKKTLFEFVKIVVERYKNHPVLEIWQVENEPFLSFGVCRNFTEDDLKRELYLIKNSDALHPTMVTDSGELSLWRKTAKVADLFGTTMYRVVWHKNFGYLSYDWLPISFYRIKLWINGRSPDTAYITELQAEPWIPDDDVWNVSFEKQSKSMDLKRLRKNIEYAARSGMPRAYLWGAEWWYWLRNQSRYEISDYIKTVNKY